MKVSTPLIACMALLAAACSSAPDGLSREQQAAHNAQEGKAFLEVNKKRPDVVTLPSGLQYRILRDAEGSIPEATDSVAVHYRGTFIDGEEFDSSYARGEPAVFRVNGVIKGWAQALQMMPTGAKWQLYIPYWLAYGSRGAGDAIGPNRTLIFEVELLEIK